MDSRPYTIHSDLVAPGEQPVDAHLMLKNQEITTASGPIREQLKSTALEAEKWLPYAAESYHVSPNLKDYVIQSVPIMYSDLPNRNGIGFPLEELTSWNADTGAVAYQTWKGKPTHIEHDNKDRTRSKGVILASSMYPMRRFQGNLYGVSLLLGFDRSKDKTLTDRILSGDSPAYSMGAICQDYKCNICAARYSRGGCEHFKLGQPRINVVDGRMAYFQAHNFIGIECSSVAVPAYFQARNTKQPMVMR